MGASPLSSGGLWEEVLGRKDEEPHTRAVGDGPRCQGCGGEETMHQKRVGSTPQNFMVPSPADGPGIAASAVEGRLAWSPLQDFWGID